MLRRVLDLPHGLRRDHALVQVDDGHALRIQLGDAPLAVLHGVVGEGLLRQRHTLLLDYDLALDTTAQVKLTERGD